MIQPSSQLPKSYDLVRSISMDKKELPQIQKQPLPALSIAGSAVSNRKDKGGPKKMKSEVFNENEVQLGIIGEKKQIMRAVGGGEGIVGGGIVGGGMVM